MIWARFAHRLTLAEIYGHATARLEEVQPGFKRDALFVYKMPAEARPAQWAFYGSQTEAENDPAVVRITRVASS